MLCSTKPFTVSVAVFFAVACQQMSFGQAQYPSRWIGNIQQGDHSGLVVAETSKPNAYAAYSKFSGKWTSYSFPEDAKITPITGGGSVVAFIVNGKAIKQLVAVDQNGRWRTQDLDAPVDANTSPLVPTITKNIAVYRIGDSTFAFSGLTGEWDSIVRPTNANVSSDIAMIVTLDRIAVFSAQVGKWAESPELASTK